jgi:hypothetical protein
MAELVFAAVLSHGPLLATDPGRWTLRASADRASKRLWFRGATYTYDELVQVRARDVSTFAAASSETERANRHASCQDALDRLAASFAAAQVDLAIVVGNDQRELLSDNLRPPILVIGAPTIQNLPLTDEERSALPPGVAEAEAGHCPPEGAEYPGASEPAQRVVATMIQHGIDVGWADSLPVGGKQRGIPHAFGFVYRRIMRDTPPPSIPIMINVGVEPNRPTASRCFAYGEALRQAVSALPSGLRVGILGSGGLSHFVVDEQLDETVMHSVRTGDMTGWRTIEEPLYEGNTGEIKNWIPVVGAVSGSALRLQQHDYVACYRTEAGTGSGMGFAAWY